MRAFTVVHSTHSLDGLLALLTPHGVETVQADKSVRYLPTQATLPGL
jgi:hypothetical protein